jgi:hypothetical protein
MLFASSAKLLLPVFIAFWQTGRAINLDLPSPPNAGVSASGHQFSVREQTADLCDAGTKQWTGTVTVGNGKKLFFCEYARLRATFCTDSLYRVLPESGQSHNGTCSHLSPRRSGRIVYDGIIRRSWTLYDQWKVHTNVSVKLGQ